MKDPIKEMTEIMRKRSQEIARDPCGIEKLIAQGKLLPEDFAETLYKAGYRKQSVGEWKQTTEPLGAHDVDCVECSSCGESWVLDEDFDYDVVKDFWNFCPNCGAKMKEM